MNGLGTVLGRLSRRAVVLCALLVLTVWGGVLLYKHAPQSNLGPILFLLGIFLVLPLTVGEVQDSSSRPIGEEEEPPFVYGSYDLRENPLQQGVDDRPLWNE